MFIRWLFIYDQDDPEQNISVEVRDEKEDVRISEYMDRGVGMLFIPSPGKDAYINLRLCKAIVREIVNEKANEVMNEQIDQNPNKSQENSASERGSSAA